MRRGELSVEPREDPELAAAPAAVPPSRAGWPHVATAPIRLAPGGHGGQQTPAGGCFMASRDIELSLLSRKLGTAVSFAQEGYISWMGGIFPQVH